MNLADTVYWINTGDNTIRAAPLGGGGTVDTLYDSGHGVNFGLGLALDPAAGRICWTNYGDSTIRGAPLAGGGTVDTLYASAQGVTDPLKLAIDTAAGRLYWSGDYGNGTVRRRASSHRLAWRSIRPRHAFTGATAPTERSWAPHLPAAAPSTRSTVRRPGGRGDRRFTDRPGWRSTPLPEGRR